MPDQPLDRQTARDEWDDDGWLTIVDALDRGPAGQRREPPTFGGGEDRAPWYVEIAAVLAFAAVLAVIVGCITILAAAGR